MGLGFWEERNKNSLLLFFCFFFAWAGGRFEENFLLLFYLILSVQQICRLSKSKPTIFVRKGKNPSSSTGGFGIQFCSFHIAAKAKYYT
jgi:hypothetical protein